MSGYVEHRWVVARRLRLVAPPVRDVFADHDAGKVDVRAWDGRHDRGIDHAQVVDRADPAMLVDYRHRIAWWAHSGGATGMELGRYRRPDIGRECVVGADRLLREQGDMVRVPGDLRLVRDLPGEAHALDQPAQILRVGGEVELDPRRDPRVGARQFEAAARVRAFKRDGQTDRERCAYRCHR